MTEIILVRYKMPKLEDECIRSVLDNTENYNLTVYDNAPENHNLGALWNRLIRNSDSDIICLLNTDTLVEKNWLSSLEQVLLAPSWEKRGAVGPCTSECKTHQKTAKTSGVVDFTHEHPGEMLGGFCLLFPKRVWEDVGGFPEDFGFYGQESAFLKKMESKGYHQYWHKGVFVYHYGSASAKEAEKRGEMDEQKEREIGRVKYQEFINKL